MTDFADAGEYEIRTYPDQICPHQLKIEDSNGTTIKFCVMVEEHDVHWDGQHWRWRSGERGRIRHFAADGGNAINRPSDRDTFDLYFDWREDG